MATDREAKMTDTARMIGHRIGEILDDIAKRKQGEPPPIGFMLFVYEHGPDGFFTYISNSDRAGALNATKEWIARAELEAAPSVSQALADVRDRVREALSTIAAERSRVAEAMDSDLSDADIDRVVAAALGSLPGVK